MCELVLGIRNRFENLESGSGFGSDTSHLTNERHLELNITLIASE